MVRKSVRTYSQILAGFARCDEEDARIRAYYEPSGPAPTTRPSLDADATQQKRPLSATRKHRYANALDWNDDITAIVNVDRHESFARIGPPTSAAAAFAADRKGNASRALAAALNCAMETATRLNQSTEAGGLTGPPTVIHGSRLAERLLREAQAPLPAPATSATPSGSSNNTPRPDDPSAASGAASGTSGPRQAWEAQGKPPSGIPTGTFDEKAAQQQQQQQRPASAYLNSSARLLYYGSTKPRIRSASPGPPGSSAAAGGRGRPLSAPSQQAPLPYNYTTTSYAATYYGSPGMVQARAGPARPSSRSSWTGGQLSTDTNAAAGAWAAGGPPTGGSGSYAVRPASARPASSAGSYAPTGSSRGSPHRRPFSAAAAAASGSPYAPSVAGTVSTAAGSAAFSTRRRSMGSGGGIPPPSLSGTTPRPQSSPSRSRSPRSSIAASAGLGGGGGAITTGPAPAPTTVSPATVRYLGVNPRQLQSTQPKHGPSNGLVIRDPVGPQLALPKRAGTGGLRPFSAPPGGTAGGGGGGGSGAEEGTSPRQQSPRMDPDQQQRSRSPSPQRLRSASPSARQRSGGVSPVRPFSARPASPGGQYGRSPSPNAQYGRSPSPNSQYDRRPLSASTAGQYGSRGSQPNPRGRAEGRTSPGRTSPARSPSPGRRPGGGGGAELNREDSLRSAPSAHTLMSSPSCGSVAVAAMAAAAAAAVNTGVTMARRRHSALAGARRALWGEIADAAGVLPYDMVDEMEAAAAAAPPRASSPGLRPPGLAAAAAGASPQMQAYLAQQATAGPASDESSATNSRVGSPDLLEQSIAAAAAAAAAAMQYQQAQPQQGLRGGESESVGLEPSAAHLLLGSAGPGASAAEPQEAGIGSAARAMPSLVPSPQIWPGAPEGLLAFGASMLHGVQALAQSHAPGGDPNGAGAGPESPRLRRLPSQGKVLRVSSLLKRPSDDPTAAGTAGAAAAGPGVGPDSGTPTGASKRVQWGGTVTAPRHRLAHQDSASAAAEPLEAGPAGVPGLGDVSDRSLMRGAGVGGGSLLSRNNSGAGGGGDLTGSLPGRPPRHPASVLVGGLSGEPAAAAGSASSPSGKAQNAGAPASSSPAASAPWSTAPGKRTNRSAGGSGPGATAARDAVYGSPKEGDDDNDELDDLPSLEVSTAAGTVDRAGAIMNRGSDAAGGSGGAPVFTQADFYHLTALVDKETDLQGWLFNVYITEIIPGNPVARRCCVATCTSADDYNRLLVPQPPPPEAATAASTSTSAPASYPGPLISPADLLPWIRRPEQLFGHWLRLEAFAIVPLAEKVVDAVTFMGLPGEATPPQPKLAKLQVLDVRTAQQLQQQMMGGRLPKTAAARAGAAGAGSGSGSGSGTGTGEEAGAGRQESGPGQSSATNAAGLMQARLVAEGLAGLNESAAAGLYPGQRPGSARPASGRPGSARPGGVRPASARPGYLR